MQLENELIGCKDLAEIQQNPCVSAVFETRNGAAEKSVYHRVLLYFSQILAPNQFVFKLHVSQFVSQTTETNLSARWFHVPAAALEG